jgi:glycosyltransferase involved in cell wall biosynthesis
MKLLMISGDRGAASGKQGAFYYTLRELTKHFDAIHVITPRVAGTPVAVPGVTFHPSPWSLLRQPKWIAQEGRRILAEQGPWTMTVQEFPPFYNGRGARNLHRVTGVPYVLEIHHIVGHPVPSSPAERAGFLLSRFYLRSDARTAAAVRTVNGEVRDILVRWGVPQEKVSVVPSFYLDADALSDTPSVAPTYDVVFVSRLVANKGLPDLLKAMTLLPHASLLVVGDGPLKQQAMRLANHLGIDHRVRFLGWLREQEDVAHAMRSAKVFVMNSRSEGGPRTALEAMALGMPVVVTRVGVMPDVIRDGQNGLFTDGTPEDLAKTLDRLLSDEALRVRLGAQARSILDLFEREETVKRYAEFLQSVALAS